jgi:hypothetical protein
MDGEEVQYKSGVATTEISQQQSID